jgi:short-subunit dehydrogenase
MKLIGCTALITGASSGIGREFARQLAGRATSMVLVARRVERLEELRNELTARDSNLKVQVFSADLSRAEEIEALCAWLEQEKIAIDLLINNAGFGDRGKFGTSDPNKTHEMLAVNVVALTMLTHRLLPAMVTRGRGGILNVSSSASFLPMTDFVVYAASKTYVTYFSEALRSELLGTGVVVTALCPGPVHTEFSQVAQRPDNREKGSPEFVYVRVEDVARVGLAGIEHDRALVVPGFFMKIFRFLVGAMPFFVFRLAARITR